MPRSWMRTYARVMFERLPTSDDRDAALHNLAGGRIDERLDALMPYLNNLNLLLDDYMVTGGLPCVVGHYAGSKTPSGSRI